MFYFCGSESVCEWVNDSQKISSVCVLYGKIYLDSILISWFICSWNSWRIFENCDLMQTIWLSKMPPWVFLEVISFICLVWVCYKINSMTLLPIRLTSLLSHYFIANCLYQSIIFKSSINQKSNKSFKLHDLQIKQLPVRPWINILLLLSSSNKKIVF